MPLVDLPADAEIIPLPQAGKLADLAPEAQVRGAYSGSVLPISRDVQGNVSFDPHAGILGKLIGAVSAPGDVYTGKAPIMTPGAPGGYNPDLINRAADFAAFFSPANPAVRAGDLPIPGEARAPMEPQPVTPPSAQQLKAVAGAGYDAARNAGVDVAGDAVSQMARGLQSGLQSGHGVIAKTAPNTFAILDELASPPQGGFATITGLEAARRGLSRIAGEGSTDGFAAGQAIRGIDNLLETLGPQNTVVGAAAPEAVAQTLKDARANYAAAQRSNDLTGTLDKATTGILERAENRAQATYSGRNLDNAIRQRIASLLEKPKEVGGFSEAEIQALNDVLQGGPVRNSARVVGNLLGGGGGWGQAATAGMGAAAGGAAGGAPGAVLGAAAPAAVGTLAKALQNALAKRALGSADAVVRQNSPLYREMLSNAPLMNPAMDRNEAVLRALLLGGAAPSPLFGSLGPII